MEIELELPRRLFLDTNHLRAVASAADQYNIAVPNTENHLLQALETGATSLIVDRYVQIPELQRAPETARLSVARLFDRCQTVLGYAGILLEMQLEYARLVGLGDLPDVLCECQSDPVVEWLIQQSPEISRAWEQARLIHGIPARENYQHLPPYKQYAAHALRNEEQNGINETLRSAWLLWAKSIRENNIAFSRDPDAWIVDRLHNFAQLHADCKEHRVQLILRVVPLSAYGKMQLTALSTNTTTDKLTETTMKTLRMSPFGAKRMPSLRSVS